MACHGHNCDIPINVGLIIINSYGFPMVFLRFPMVFPCFPMVFPRFSYGFPMAPGALLPAGPAGGPAALGTRGPPLERPRRQPGRGLRGAGAAKP